MSKPPKPGFVSIGGMRLAGLSKPDWNSGEVDEWGCVQGGPIPPSDKYGIEDLDSFTEGNFHARDVIQSSSWQEWSKALNSM